MDFWIPLTAMHFTIPRTAMHFTLGPHIDTKSLNIKWIPFRFHSSLFSKSDSLVQLNGKFEELKDEI